MSLPHPVTHSPIWLSTEEYLSMILNEELDTISFPPVKPKPGEIYLYFNPDHCEDWKSDQHRWRNKGNGNIPRSNPKLYCIYYQSYCGALYFKRAFRLYPPKNNSRILIHYVGDISSVKHAPHGNQKFNLHKKHIMTAKSQLHEQKKQLNLPPNKVYKNILSTVDVHPALSPVMLPRDRKQVTNTITNERERRLLSKDDIIGLYMVNSELGGFVEMLELLPEFFTILYSTKSRELFENIVNKTLIRMFYDTTFNLGDFYVSILTYQHTYFNPSPVIPLFYLLHHKKTETVHTKFFKHVKEKCPVIDGIIIVTDREEAITNSIKKVLDKSTNFFCWNHLQQDVKNWVNKQKNFDFPDIKVYINHIWDLLDSDDRTSFDTKLSGMMEHWSENFKKYFKKYLLADILTSTKWKLIASNVYTTRTGITTNAAESINAVLKRFLEKKEVKAQALALTLYQLDLYYQKEILRGLCNMGSYNLKTQFQSYCLDPCCVDFPVSNIDLEKLPYIFTNRDFNNKETATEIPYTNFGIAKMLVLENRVRLIPEEQVFIVSGLKNKNLVKLHPTESCSCSAKRYCHHIDAAKISIGITENKHKKLKLATLLKRKRGFRSGRKKPQDIAIIKAAEDSLVNKSLDANVHHSLLVPTRERGIVKSRFLKINDIEKKSENKENEFYASTPKSIFNVDKLRPRSKFAELSNLSLSSESDEILSPENANKNKQHLVFGRQIYDNELKSLITKSKVCADRYISDSILDIYPLILLKIEASKLKNINVFCAETTLLSHFDRSANSFWLTTVQYKIPEYDVIIFPYHYSSHFVVIIVLNKQKIILYLDSLGGVCVKPLHFLIRLFSLYSSFKKTPFDINMWQIVAPEDIPMQKNSYDCGMYVLMVIESCLKQDVNVFKYHSENGMSEYRNIVREKINDCIKKNDTNVFYEIDKNFNKQAAKDFFCTFKHILNEEQSIRIQRQLLNSTDTKSFIANVLKNYWDENSVICNFTFCPGLQNKMLVLCEVCVHWYHFNCEKLREEDSLPSSAYICQKCQKASK